MRRFLFFLLVALCASVAPAAAEVTWQSDGRGELLFHVHNTSAAPENVQMAAGTIFRLPNGRRVVALRDVSTSVPPGQSADGAVPSAALSSANAQSQPQSATPEPGAGEPRLQALLKWLPTQPDLPRSTSQCAVLLLLEDVSFPQWLAFRAASATSSEPVVEAVDALGLLREVVPEQRFHLADDPQLRFRALHTPATRSKAVLVFGVNASGDPAPAPVPASIGQLLHTKPGDNCPVCRMRAQMQAPANSAP